MKGETAQLTVTYTPSNAEIRLTWFSGDPSIADVSEEGVVRALSPGTAIIYARAENGVTGVATVKVTDNAVVSIRITPDDLLLELEESSELRAEVSPEYAEAEITWSSRDPKIAAVTQEGVVTGVGKGSTFIYARAANGVTGIATVSVIDSKEVTSLRVVPESLNLISGEAAQLEVVLTPSTASPEITWISADTSVAEVSDAGVVTAVGTGATIIYARIQSGMTGFATVNVYDNEVASVTIEPDILTLEIDETGELTAFVQPEVAEAGLSWSSSDGTVAEVDDAGRVKAKGQGYTFIYARADNGVTGIAIVRVIDPNAEDYNPDYGYGDNGVYVSAVRTREGNPLGLFAERPTGYENNDWSYDWYVNGDITAEGKYVIVAAGLDSGWKGNDKYTVTERYEAEITNLIGDEVILGLPDVRVYARPLTPDELLRKGDGASHSFVAMSSLSDAELSGLGYSFVFGYTDEEGVNHVISNSPLRYCHTTRDIYGREDYRFWVYTTWTFGDGVVITSGLRYLDGSVEEGFDRSDYNFSVRGSVESIDGEYGMEIYTIDGHNVGRDLDRLSAGIYIIRERKGKLVSTRKIIKR